MICFQAAVWRSVASGDEVIAPLNRYIKHFRSARLPIYATRDWHPEGHCSFQESGGIWPPHCLAGSAGARFPSSLALPEDVFVGGLATDYCVLNTVLDALTEGFDVILLQDAMRAVDLHPGDGDAAVRKMRQHGARSLMPGEIEGAIE